MLYKIHLFKKYLCQLNFTIKVTVFNYIANVTVFNLILVPSSFILTNFRYTGRITGNLNAVMIFYKRQITTCKLKQYKKHNIEEITNNNYYFVIF